MPNIKPPGFIKKSERNCLREHPIESEQVQVFAWCEISNLDESKSAGWLRSKRKKRAPDCVKNVKLYGTKENDLRVCCHFDSTASQFLLIRSECARILNILAENSKHLDIWSNADCFLQSFSVGSFFVPGIEKEKCFAFLLTNSIVCPFLSSVFPVFTLLSSQIIFRLFLSVTFLGMNAGRGCSFLYMYWHTVASMSLLNFNSPRYEIDIINILFYHITITISAITTVPNQPRIYKVLTN